MTDRVCTQCGESWFMADNGDDLCKDCRRWAYEQSDAGVKAKADAAKFKRQKAEQKETRMGRR